MVAALQGVAAEAVAEWKRRGHPEEPLRLAATRILLRLLVIQRAEGAGLLPVEEPLYRSSYSLRGLHHRLASDRRAGTMPLAGRGYAWARLKALFRLVWGGSDHPALPVRAYGGELFEPPPPDPSEEGARGGPGAGVGRAPYLPGPGGGDLVQQALAVLQVHGPDDAGVLAVLDRLAECESSAGGADSSAARVVGTLYEELLEWRLELEPGKPEAVKDRSRRKGTGSFYTPPELASEVVRSTLGPLIEDAEGRPFPPERLLALKVCDPAMGSGSFLTAALHVLSRALAASVAAHGRFRPAHSGPGRTTATVADLGNGLRLELPGSPGERAFDEMLRVRLRRLVVENCLWGVDLDPAAVELARTVLWIETLDRRLPFTFLDHKLVPGDALVGCRLDDLDVYPLAAWDGERSFPAVMAEARSLLQARSSPPLPFPGFERPEVVRRRLSGCLEELKSIPVEFPDRKRQAFRSRVSGDDSACVLRKQMDRWCLLWFTSGVPGPGRPGPRRWLNDGAGGLEKSAEAARERRFFHWELEFPDVFEGAEPGFDALIGNPPWEVLRARPGRFMLSRWIASRSCPGGALDARWRAFSGAPGAGGPFRLQGPGDHNTYRLFLEQGWHLLRPGGRLGFLVPGGLASDRGAAPLRRLFLDEGCWERLVSFDNRNRLFPVDGRLKFCAVVVSKGGRTRQVSTSFGNESATPAAGTPWPRELLELHSADLAFPELADAHEVSLFSSVHRQSVPLCRWPPSSAPPRYVRELDAGNPGGRFAPVAVWEARGATPMEADLWQHHGSLLLPVVHGALVHPYAVSGCAQGEGLAPRDLLPVADYRKGTSRGLKIAVRRVTNATNTRTLIAALVPDLPCTDKAAVLSLQNPVEMLGLAALLNSFAPDFVARRICAGTNLDRHHLVRLPLPATDLDGLALRALRLGACHPLFAPLWLHCAERWPALLERPWRAWWAVTPASRTALKVEADLLAASAYGLTPHDLDRMLADCGHPPERLASPSFAATLPRRGFWRVDRDRSPEGRHTELVRILARSGLPAPGWEDSLTAHLGPLLGPWQEGLDVAGDWACCRGIAQRLLGLGFRLLPERKGLL